MRKQRATTSFKRQILSTCGGTALILAASAAAQSAYAQAPAPQAAQEQSVEEIVVTGTRVVRDGYEAPTPLTVVGIEEINDAARPNIADFVNTLPTFAGSKTPHDGGVDVSSGRQGQNNLNLRGLGVNRTLTLLDGHRIVSGDTNGAVNINDFPQSLVARVDVVTGGASAAYGSDALSGVVNFVLDKNYVGIKGEASGGVTTYGDDRSYKLSLTAGTGFANDRGHFLISAEHNHIDGVLGIPRAWNKNPTRIMPNSAYSPTNGQPQFLIRDHVGLILATRGGIIVSGPLKGIEFGVNGIPRQFNYGSQVGGSFMQGGDWQYADATQDGAVDSPLTRQNLFARATYDLTDDIQVSAQYIYGYSTVFGHATSLFILGTLVIKNDNALLPPEVAARMSALGLTQFSLGTLNPDLPGLSTLNNRLMRSYSVGLNGKIDAFGSHWSWDAYYQKGTSRSFLSAHPYIVARMNQAIDAVRNPTTGAIVCRSTLTAPTNGCVPYNTFGIGVNSQAAINYVTGTSYVSQRVVEDVATASIQGEPFSDWAGPVSLAAGIEHRKESVSGANDPLSAARAYSAGNFQATFGSYNVTEGYAEVVIPLAKDEVWAKAFDLNAAVRATSYSTSGYVTTWKVGATYSPIDEIRFRATRSRDIRAPNLNDQFLAGTGNSNPGLLDPFQNNVVIPTILANTIGNPNLKPEKADTTGLGVVVQPAFFPGFNASFDLYNIDIGGAITTLSTQDTLNRCFLGNQDLCGRIARDANGVITIITVSPFNLVTQTTRGFDIEASYRTRFDNISSNLNGDLTLRALGTHVFFLRSNDGVNPVVDAAGTNSGGGPVKWHWLLSATYSNDPFSVALTGRLFTGGTYLNTYIQCTSGCPTSSPLRPTIDSNYIPGAFYTDIAFTYKVANKSDHGADVETFLTIQNLTNKDPATVANTNHYLFSANPTLYDVLGRVFRAGVRFKM